MTETIRVLHVDDEPDFAETTATFLERENDRFSVETASDAEEGLRRLNENEYEYDCIVSDYEMPKKGGIELLREVRERNPDQPFVLFTVKGSEEVASEAISEGVTDYLRKRPGTERYKLLANRITNAVEKHAAEKKARWNRKIIQGMKEAVYVVNPEYELRFFNYRVPGVRDTPDEELAGRSLSSLTENGVFTSDEVEIIKEGIDRILNGETDEVRVDVKLRLPDPNQVAELLLGPLSVGDEDLVLATTREITERREREKELHRSRELLRKTEELAKTGGWETDVETGEQRWTDGVYRILEIPPDSDSASTVEDTLEFYHPDDREAMEAAVERCVDSGEPFDERLRVNTAEDTLRWVRSMGEPECENGEVIGMRGAAQDITEQRQRKQELRELNERLDLAAEAAGLGVWDWDTESGDIKYNERWAEILGLPTEDGMISNESARDRLHPEDVHRVERATREVLEGEKDRYDDEIRLETADGGWKWVRTVGQVAERDGDGKATRVVGVNVDIDDEKRQKEELERHKTFIQSSPDVITHLDVDGEILYQSPSVERIGYSQDESVGDTAFEYVHPDDREKVQQEFLEVLGNPEKDSGVVEYRVLNGEGEYIWAEATGTDQRDTETGGIVISQRDITKRKQREREVKEAHQQLRQIVDLIPDPIFVKSLDDEVLLSNEANAELHGMTPEEIEGRKEREIEPEVENIESFDRYRRREAEVIETGDPMTFEEELMDPGGETHAFKTTRIPFEAASTEEDAVLGYARDITSLKEYEQELERSNEKLDRFARVVSHDLRNPLSVAKGRLELAQKECDSNQLDEVEGALDRMEALIQDILTLAREGSDLGEMEVIETEQVVEDCWGNVETEKATLVNELERKVEADPGRFKQLFENLIRNALEHGGDDVTVTVGELDDGDGFYFADDGEGIPQEQREDVFETGYSTSEDGTGFGLSIVEEIIKVHAWDIEVTESEAGGARFEVSGVDLPEPA